VISRRGKKKRVPGGKKGERSSLKKGCPSKERNRAKKGKRKKQQLPIKRGNLGPPRTTQNENGRFTNKSMPPCGQGKKKGCLLKKKVGRGHRYFPQAGGKGCFTRGGKEQHNQDKSKKKKVAT